MDHVTELALLVELDRTGNLRRAADALAISQSTLSAALVRMERRYGQRLFERDQRGTRATPAGRLVVAAAQESLTALENARRRVELLGTSRPVTVAIGADPSLVEAFVVPTIAALLAEPEGIRVSVRSGSADELLELLRAQRIEYSIGLRPDGPLDGVSVRTIASVPVVAFCRAGHPLADLPPLGVQVVRDYPLVVTSVPRWYRQEVRQELPVEAGGAIEADGDIRTIELEDYGAVRTLVERSDAIGLAPLASVRGAVDAGTLVVLGVPEDQQTVVRDRSIVVATLKDRPLPPFAQRSLELLVATVEAQTS